MTYQENLIYDVGFHKGEDTRVYLREGFRVVAIEANPLLAEEGKKLFAKEIQDCRLTLLNIGVGNEFGELDFWVNDYLTEWSSFDKSAGCRSGSACHSVKVKCIPLTEVFKEYGVPFYFKVDIEGYDIYCLQQIDPACKPKYLSTEAWSVEWLRLLHEKGYTKFKIINQVDGFHPIDIARERSKIRYIRNRFYRYFMKNRKDVPYVFGSSGPFAEQTEGPWLDFKTAEDLFCQFKENGTGKPINPLSWFDFHATY